jgi:Protein of unknown function (DUF1826)
MTLETDFYLARPHNELARTFAYILDSCKFYSYFSVPTNDVDFKFLLDKEYQANRGIYPELPPDIDTLYRLIVENPREAEAFKYEILNQIKSHPKLNEVKTVGVSIRTSTYEYNPLFQIWHADGPPICKLLSTYLGAGTQWFHPGDIDISRIKNDPEIIPPYEYLQAMEKQVMRQAELFGYLYINAIETTLIHRAPQVGTNPIGTEDYEFIKGCAGVSGRIVGKEVECVKKMLQDKLSDDVITPRCLVTILSQSDLINAGNILN